MPRAPPQLPRRPSLWNGWGGWLSHQGSARATSSRRRLICISKGPPRPHPLPQEGPEMRVYPRALRLWGSRGRPAQPSQAPTPTAALEPPGGGRAAGGQARASAASARASRPKWGQRGPPAPRALRSKDALNRGAQARVGGEGGFRGLRGSRPGQGAASRPRQAPWPAATGSRAGGRREGPAARSASETAWPGAGSEGRRSPRSSSRPPGPGRPRGRRPLLPSPRPPPPPSSRRRAAAATARAAGGARNGARLAASPGRGERGSRGARRPQARGPRNGLRAPRPARGAGPCGLSGPPPAPGSRPRPGKEGGRQESRGRH